MTNAPVLPNSKLLSDEPAITVGGSSTLAILVINALVSYAIPITADLKILIVVIIGAVGPVISGYITRRFAFSPTTVAAMHNAWSAATQAARQSTPEPSTTPRPPGI